MGLKKPYWLIIFKTILKKELYVRNLMMVQNSKFENNFEASHLHTTIIKLSFCNALIKFI